MPGCKKWYQRKSPAPLLLTYFSNVIFKFLVLSPVHSPVNVTGPVVLKRGYTHLGPFWCPVCTLDQLSLNLSGWDSGNEFLKFPRWFQCKKVLENHIKLHIRTVSQPWNYWHLGPDDSILGTSHMYRGMFSSSLASTHVQHEIRTIDLGHKIMVRNNGHCIGHLP